MEILYRALVAWPGELTRHRKRSPFKASYSNTVDLLESELRWLKAKDIFLQVALLPGDIRLDGLPRSGARPSHPGIILTFESRFGPLSYPCDTFDSWESNLRAIALSLQHLRTVDRYGVTRRGEQYQGWARLPAPSNGVQTAPQAVELLRRFAPDLVAAGKLQEAWRAACLKTHPDRGGSADDFNAVQSAKDILQIN